MQGRWTITVDANGILRHTSGAISRIGERRVPVVPCDDAAIERGAAAMVHAGVLSHRAVAEMILRAAGETT